MAERVALDIVGETWLDVAARLASVVRCAGSADEAGAILRQTVRMLGGVGYPGFLKILKIIAESDNEVAKYNVARAIGVCLQRSDLPAGELTSWGASSLHAGDEPISADELIFQSGSVAPRRSFGPIEYVTVWYCQGTQRPYLSYAVCREVLFHIIALCNYDATAARIYPVKLESELAAGPDGAYTRETRNCLRCLAAHWKKGEPPAVVVSQALSAIGGNTDQRQLWLHGG